MKVDVKYMYLISIYFDKKTNRKIQHYIDKVAKKTRNTYMVDGQVPPHITISAFETLNEKCAIEALEHAIEKLRKGKVEWVSVGQFFPYVIFLEPVLNQYLHNLCSCVNNELSHTDTIKISPYYMPFQWIPHTTIAKKLSKEEMKIAFEVMQESFGMFEGEVVKIGLAKPNPHRDIATWELR